MRLKTTLITAFVACASVSHAQYENYKLSDYVNPTYQRKTLDADFNTSGNFSKTDEKTDNGVNGNLGLNFTQVANSKKLQQETSIYWGMGTAFSRNKVDYNSGSYYSNVSRVNNKNFDTNLKLNHSSLFYKENKTFIEFSPQATLRIGWDRHAELGKDTTQRNDFDTNLIAKIGFGFGRIEYVTDARQAVYIAEELSKKGILKRTMTNEEITALAEQITDTKNKRHFDPRIKLAEEIAVVDSFLVANNLVEETNGALYFTSLYDKWMYGDRDVRQSGSRIKGGVSPLYSFDRYSRKRSDSYTNYNANQKYRNINASYGGMVYVDYKNEKPLNLKLQQSISVEAMASYSRLRQQYALESYSYDYYGYGGYDGYDSYNRYRDSDKTYFNQVAAELVGAYSLGYYVNTRTYVVGGISEHLRWAQYTKHANFDEANLLASYTHLYAKAYYYLSPQLRLFGECNFTYAFDRNMNKNTNAYNKYPTTNFSVRVKLCNLLNRPSI